MKQLDSSWKVSKNGSSEKDVVRDWNGSEQAGISCIFINCILYYVPLSLQSLCSALVGENL